MQTSLLSTLGGAARDWLAAGRLHRSDSFPAVHDWWVPVAGAGIAYAQQGPPWLLARARERGMNEPFAIQLPGGALVLCHEPDFVRRFYHSPVDDVSFWDGLEIFPSFEKLIPLGLSGPEDANVGIHALRAHLPQIVLTGTEGLDDALRECLREELRSGRADLETMWRRAILRITSTLLAGERISSDRTFIDAMLEFDVQMLESVRTMGGERATRAGERVRGLALTRLYNEIERRRREGHEGEARDFLDAMIAAKDAEGEPLADAVIASDLVGYHFGTTANTPSAATMMTTHILMDPALNSAILDEQREVMREHGDTIDKRALRKMPLLLASYREVLRCYAPGLHTRVTRTEMEVGGFRLAAGTRIGVSPYIVHHNPEHYDDPRRLRPAALRRWPSAPCVAALVAEFHPLWARRARLPRAATSRARSSCSASRDCCVIMSSSSKTRAPSAPPVPSTG